MANEGIPPLYQCSACTKYDKGCDLVKGMETLLSNCPSLDRDTLKCTEYQPAREWNDLEQALYKMTIDKSAIQYDLTKDQQEEEIDSFITWDSLEQLVYLAIKKGRKPTGIVVGESALSSLDPYGTLKGYRIQAISVLDHTLSVTVSPYSGNRILLKYR